MQKSWRKVWKNLTFVIYFHFLFSLPKKCKSASVWLSRMGAAAELKFVGIVNEFSLSNTEREREREGEGEGEGEREDQKIFAASNFKERWTSLLSFLSFFFSLILRFISNSLYLLFLAHTHTHSHSLFISISKFLSLRLFLFLFLYVFHVFF